MLQFTETKIIGKQIFFFNEIDSTNVFLLQNKDKHIFKNGCLVFTNFQTNGKGYATNKWQSNKGKNALFSILLKPNFLPIYKQFLINKMVCVAIVNALKNITNLNFEIKWPNDIFYKNRKIAGILIQNSLKGNKFEKMVIGIGLNVNETSFGLALPNATSLKIILNTEFKIIDIIEKIAINVDYFYGKIVTNEVQIIENEYFAKLYKRNLWSNFKKPVANDLVNFKGKIIGTDEIGRLKIEKENGEIELFGFKEVLFDG